MSDNQVPIFDELNRLNPIELHFHGQEIIQDVINRLSDLHVSIKIAANVSSSAMSLSDINSYQQRKQKLEDLLQYMNTSFYKLRLISRLLTQNSTLPNQTSSVSLQQHQNYLKEQLKDKNSQLKLIIDHVNHLVWQINSMQSIKAHD